MKRLNKGLLQGLAFGPLVCGLVGCVPSVFPMVVQKEKTEKPPVTQPVIRETVPRVNPGQIDDANAAEMLKAIRREIDIADSEPLDKP